MSMIPKPVMEMELSTMTVLRVKMMRDARPYFPTALWMRITPAMEVTEQPAAISSAWFISFIPSIKYCIEDIDAEKKTMKQLVDAVTCP